MKRRSALLWTAPAIVAASVALAEGTSPPSAVVPEAGQAQTASPVQTPSAEQGSDQSQSEGGDLTKMLEEALTLRDPFKRPDSAQSGAETLLSDLERYPTEQFKLVGIITGPSRLRAIIQDPTGKTHFVAERMRIGTRRGIIRKIRTDAVIVREKMVNVLGKEEAADSEIRLPDERPGAGGSSG